MPSDAPTSQPSAKDRRTYFRVNAVLPISIQAETDTTEGVLIEKSVNISGGGIGVTVNVVYKPDEILSLTLVLPDQVIFKAYAEVLRLEPIPHHVDTDRLTHPLRQDDHTESGIIDQTHPTSSTRPPRETLFRIIRAMPTCIQTGPTPSASKKPPPPQRQKPNGPRRHTNK